MTLCLNFTLVKDGNDQPCNNHSGKPPEGCRLDSLSGGSEDTPRPKQKTEGITFCRIFNKAYDDGRFDHLLKNHRGQPPRGCRLNS